MIQVAEGVLCLWLRANQMSVVLCGSASPNPFSLKLQERLKTIDKDLFLVVW